MRRFLAGCLFLLLMGCGDILGCVGSPSMRTTNFADPWRVFYRVEEQTVTVELIGQKKGNVLLIGGKEFKL